MKKIWLFVECVLSSIKVVEFIYSKIFFLTWIHFYYYSEDDSSESTDEDVDLEEGEILDSGEEEEEKEKKDLTNSKRFVWSFFLLLKELFFILTCS